MLEITSTFHMDERELQFNFIRAAGPGGQHVNKAATAVQLRFDVQAASLPDSAKTRLISLAGHRMTNEGILQIEAKRFRTQEQNRADAIQRFTELVRRSLIPPKMRKQTKPTSASKTTRLKAKKVKGEIKRLRKKTYDLE